MDNATYDKIEQYMLKMSDAFAHDSLHIYRVLKQALKIAENHKEVNRDILIAACLLHDIGREAQFKDPNICHAVEGGKMAYEFLLSLGWSGKDCAHVKDCITSHRFRNDLLPETIEAKILFDSDKLDVTGALGIARSFIYMGQVGVPLYSVDENNAVLNGSGENEPDSFFKEYHIKLKKLYDGFYTEEARRIAQKRREFIKLFYDELLDEVSL
ncbi:MAG: HD domain-containing protein [Clostridia bacterium]|nr:HD domain-containing protein [Clostridia bacterium]